MSNKRAFPYSAFGPNTRQRIETNHFRSGLRYAGIGGAGLAAAASYAMNRYGRRGTGNLRGARTIRRGRGRPGVTVQHDRANVYRKRSMPRRKKRSWKRFSRKVNAVAEKSLGSKTIVFNVAQSFIGTPGTTEQLWANLALYPMNHSSVSYLDDMSAIENNSTGDYGVTTKYIFKSGVLDMTLVNSSFDDAEGGVPIELDVYEITSSSSWQENSGTPSLIGVFQQGFTDTTAEGSAGTQLATTQRGVTPWDCPQALGSYRIKIWKKTKFFLGAGGWMTYQIRDPKRHVLDAKNMREWDSTNKPGLTRWLLLVAKALPGANIITTGNVALEVGITRKYMYKINQDSTDQDGFNVT